MGMGYHAQNYSLPCVVARFLDLQFLVQSLIFANDSDAAKNITTSSNKRFVALVPARSEQVKMRQWD